MGSGKGYPLHTQLAEKGFHDPLQGEEVVPLPVHADGGHLPLIGQFLPLHWQIDTSDLIESGRFVAVVVVAGEHLQHGGDGGGAHHAGVLTQGIQDGHTVAVPILLRETDLIIIFGADEGVGGHFIEPLSQKYLVDQTFKLLFGSVAAVCHPSDGGGGNPVVAIEPGNLLGDIRLMLQIPTEAGRQHIVPIKLAI